jgi:hypothetical protein
MDVIFAFLMLFCLVTVCVAVLAIPIMIANARGVSGGERTAIIILSVLGVFFGLTWFVALLMSLLCRGTYVVGDELDKLEKLSKLYKDKVISKSEYESMKSKLLHD